MSDFFQVDKISDRSFTMASVRFALIFFCGGEMTDTFTPRIIPH